MVVQMIQVGEETGTFGEISKRLAEFYEEEVSTITKGLSSIIEPILMIIIGAAVGLFAVSDAPADVFDDERYLIFWSLLIMRGKKIKTLVFR